jgi:predicted amidohydrolase
MTPSSDTLNIAAVQMVSAASLAPNLEAAARLVRQAADGGAQVAVLPEFFCLLGRKDSDKVDLREPAGHGPIQTFLSELARECGLWLIGGTVPIASSEPRRIWNACLVYGPQGQLQARYDKVHLFGLRRGNERFDESATIVPASTPVVCDLPVISRASEGSDRSSAAEGSASSGAAEGSVASVASASPWRVGLSVCYDLRFPEYYRALGRVDLAVVPSAFTYLTGQAHWEVLLRARAIENQCYIVAPAQGGVHENGRRTWGHTLIIDPWGEVLGCLPEGEGLVHARIDRARISQVRAELPALSHRVM